MAQKIRVGVIGLGRMGRRHLQAYLASSKVTVVACCDANPGTFEFLNGKLECKKYTDWHEMVANETLDLLSVVTNAPTHAEITIAAANAKVPRIICEKPMATSVQDAIKMIEVTDANGAKLAVNYSRRWSEDYRKLKLILREGTIGVLCEIYCVCGGGQLACNGSHFFDLMRFMSDSEPSSLIGFVDKRGTPNPRGPQFTDPGAFCLLQFENGMRGFVDMYEDLGIPPRIDIVGSIGRVSIDETTNSWVIETRQGDDRTQPLGKYDLKLVKQVLPTEPLDPLRLVERTIDEMLSERPLACSGRDGLAALQMVMGVHASDAEGNKHLPLPLPDTYRKLAINFT